MRKWTHSVSSVVLQVLFSFLFCFARCLFLAFGRVTCMVMHLSLWQLLHRHSSLFWVRVASEACSGSASTFNSLTTEVSVFSQTIKCNRRSLHPPFPLLIAGQSDLSACPVLCLNSPAPDLRRKEKNRNGLSLCSNHLVLAVLGTAQGTTSFS